MSRIGVLVKVRGREILLASFIVVWIILIHQMVLEWCLTSKSVEMRYNWVFHGLYLYVLIRSNNINWNMIIAMTLLHIRSRRVLSASSPTRELIMLVVMIGWRSNWIFS